MSAEADALPPVTAVHSHYSSSTISGENVAFEMQIDALRSAGYRVVSVERHTDVEESSALFRVRSAVRVATGWDPVTSLSGDADPGRVLYVHNAFPNFGTKQLIRWAGPLVAVAHNYRSVCANGLLFRDGDVCTLCPGGHRESALRHRCYRGSLLATLPLYVGSRHPFASDSLFGRADRVVVQSRHAARVFADAGLPAERTAVVPGFVEEPASWTPRPATPGRWIAVGRLSEEKGFVSLARQWSEECHGHELDIVGDGPESTAVARAGGGRVQMLGRRDREWILDALADYSGLVFPGRCIEGAHPLVVREAVARGVPVVVAAGTSADEVAIDMGAGVGYDAVDGASLAAALEIVSDAGMDLRQGARAAYEAHFTQAVWLSSMSAVFRDAVAAAATRG